MISLSKQILTLALTMIGTVSVVHAQTVCPAGQIGVGLFFDRDGNTVTTVRRLSVISVSRL